MCRPGPITAPIEVQTREGLPTAPGDEVLEHPGHQASLGYSKAVNNDQRRTRSKETVATQAYACLNPACDYHTVAAANVRTQALLLCFDRSLRTLGRG